MSSCQNLRRPRNRLLLGVCSRVAIQVRQRIRARESLCRFPHYMAIFSQYSEEMYNSARTESPCYSIAKGGIPVVTSSWYSYNTRIETRARQDSIHVDLIKLCSWDRLIGGDYAVAGMRARKLRVHYADSWIVPWRKLEHVVPYVVTIQY